MTTWLPSASLQTKGLATKYTTVKWLIKRRKISKNYTPLIKENFRLKYVSLQVK